MEYNNVNVEELEYPKPNPRRNDGESLSSAGGRKSQSSAGKERSRGLHNNMRQEEFLENSKIHKILRHFESDVVNFKTSEKNKWKEAVDAVRASSAMNFGNQIQQIHDHIPQDEVEDKLATWKMYLKKNTNKSGIDEGQSGTSETHSSKTGGSRLNPAIFNSAQLLPCIKITVTASNYSSGILAGLLICRAWFESFIGYSSIWGAVHCPIFYIILSGLSTILLLFTVIGFLCRLDITQTSNILRKWFIYFIPILLIVSTHYLYQSFQFHHKECTEYVKIRNELLSERIGKCNSYKIGDGESVLIVLRVILAATALGLYTFIQFNKNNGPFIQ